METETLIKSWEDLVFRNRNKDYGAFAIRKAYSRRVMLGAGFSIALIAAFLVFTGITKEVAKIVSPPTVEKEGWREFIQEPYIEKPKPRKNDQPPKSTSNNTTIKVVNTAVDSVVDNHEDHRVVTGVTEGTEDGTLEGNGESNVSIPIEVDTKKEYNIVEQMPAYDGGVPEMMKFIQRKIRYPSSAKNIKAEGTVYVSFLVNGDGSVSDVKVLRGFHKKCDEEAVRVIGLLPDWIGGKQGGVPVSVRMVLPIKFTLE